MFKIDKKKISIAVIGRSMTGKTTWITSLFRQDINIGLRTLCLENREGQTKLKIRYELADPDSDHGIYVKEMAFVREELEKVMDGDRLELVEKLGKLGVVIDRHELEESKDRTFIIHPAAQSVDTEMLFRELVNDVNMSDSGIFQGLVISAPAAPEVWKTINEYGLEQVTICDARGMMDETERFDEKIKEISKLSDENGDKSHKTGGRPVQADSLIKKLLNERGVSGADVCVFMTDGGRDMLVKGNKERYAFLFQYISRSMPVFVTSLSGILSGVLEAEGSGADYSFYSRLMETDEDLRFSDNRLKREYNCMPIRELMDDFAEKSTGSGQKADDIRKENISALLLPRVNTGDEGDYGLYQNTACWALKAVLGGAYDYKALLAQFEEQNEKLPEILKSEFHKVFREVFAGHMGRWGKYYIYSRFYGEQITLRYEEEIKKPYYGGLLGVRGGMTTWIKGYGRSGKYAISLLETAYNEFEQISGLICGNSYASHPDYSVKLSSYLARMLDSFSLSYSCTGIMLMEEALHEAWKYTNDMIKERGEGFTYDFLEKYDASVSVVYCMMDRLLWNVIEHSEKSGIVFHQEV